MPGSITGIDVVERMRQDYPAIPMYIVTARTNVVGEEWRTRNHVTLISKPYEPEDLVRLITQALPRGSGPGRGDHPG